MLYLTELSQPNMLLWDRLNISFKISVWYVAVNTGEFEFWIKFLSYLICKENFP